MFLKVYCCECKWQAVKICALSIFWRCTAMNVSCICCGWHWLHYFIPANRIISEPDSCLLICSFHLFFFSLNFHWMHWSTDMSSERNQRTPESLHTRRLVSVSRGCFMAKSLNHLFYNSEWLRAEGIITSDKVLLCTADAMLAQDAQSMGTSSHMVRGKLIGWRWCPLCFAFFSDWM